MPSGKQILLFELQKLSQTKTLEADTDQAVERLKSALCLHCSTSSETMEQIQRVSWLSEHDEEGLVKQGIGLSDSQVFISDLFEELSTDEDIPMRIKDRFPTLSKEDYSVGMNIIWQLLSSLQYWEELSTVENKGKLEIHESENLMATYTNALKNFEKEPW